MIPNIDLQMLKSVSTHVKGTPSITFATEGVSLSGQPIRQNSLFIPLENSDAENRASLIEAMENGAIGALWKKSVSLPANLPNEFPIFLVDNLVEALKKLAFLYYEEVDPTVVAITGCEGSNFTKDLAAHLLQKNYHIVQSMEKNMSVEKLCALILNMDRTTTLLISEYNVPKAAEMVSFLQPQFTAITDITPGFFNDELSYDEIFSHMVNMEKNMRVTANVLIDGDDERLRNYEWQTDIATCGRSDGNLFQLEHVEKNENYLTFRLKGIFQPFTIHGNDERFVKYSLFAIALCIQLGMFADEIEDRMRQFSVGEDYFIK